MALMWTLNDIAMWSWFARKKTSPLPTVLVGDMSIRWNGQLQWWEFNDGEYEYSLAENPKFDIVFLDQLAAVKRWLADLDRDIESKIKQHVDGWCEWNGEKHVVGIDVSRLISDREIDVSYADGEKWGDLVINIVIADGRITDSYAGD